MKKITDLCDVLTDGFGLRRQAVEWLAEEFQRRGFTGPPNGLIDIESAALFLLACTSEQPLHPAVAVERFDAMTLGYIVMHSDDRGGVKLTSGDPLFDSIGDVAGTFAGGVAMKIQAATQVEDISLGPSFIRIATTARYHSGVVAIDGIELFYFASDTEEIGMPIPERRTIIPGSFIKTIASMVAWPGPGPGPGESAPVDEMGGGEKIERKRLAA